MRRILERRALRAPFRADRSLVRREHVLAHELERDDFARLEDGVLLRWRSQRARQAELGRQTGDQVVRILGPSHVDLDDGQVVRAVEWHPAEILGAQAVAKVEQAAEAQ